jgi:hypothetical protein
MGDLTKLEHILRDLAEERPNFTHRLHDGGDGLCRSYNLLARQVVALCADIALEYGEVGVCDKCRATVLQLDLQQSSDDRELCLECMERIGEGDEQLPEDVATDGSIAVPAPWHNHFLMVLDEDRLICEHCHVVGQRVCFASFGTVMEFGRERELMVCPNCNAQARVKR